MPSVDSRTALNLDGQLNPRKAVIKFPLAHRVEAVLALRVKILSPAMQRKSLLTGTLCAWYFDALCHPHSPFCVVAAAREAMRLIPSTTCRILAAEAP
jgi:hypothetical protein